MVLPSGYQSLSGPEKLDILWKQISAVPYTPHTLPTKDTLYTLFSLGHLGNPNFDKVVFTHESDELPDGRRKLLHPYGAVAKVEWEIFGNSPYTGVFQAGTRTIGLARCSLAISDRNENIPALGIKIFVDGKPSQNFHIMHNLDGQGKNQNYFQAPFWNILDDPKTLKVKALHIALTAAVKRLPGEEKDRPESAVNLGLTEQASIKINGDVVAHPVVPYRIESTPAAGVGWSVDSEHDFRTNLSMIPEGTVLYEIAAKSEENVEQVVIGRLTSRSPFVASQYGDEHLHFQHASKRWEQPEGQCPANVHKH